MESYADIIHKSLRLVCKDQADWSKHIQSIAYSYRASATTNVMLSPFEIVFGKRMELPIDVSMGAPEILPNGPEAYYTEVGPKLEILHQIAQQNATDSATRQRHRVNQGAKLPTYKPGDKVLLYNPVTKTGENPKLKVRYEPYLIKETRPGYTYRLQNLKSGIDLKRAVHARRLRPLMERDNEPTVTQHDSTIILERMVSEGLKVKIVLADVVTMPTDALVCFVDRELLPIGELSDRILSQGGPEVVQEQLQIVQVNIGAELPSALITTAGTIDSCHRIIHSVIDSKLSDLKMKLIDVFKLADESVSMLTLPFPDFYDSEGQVWSISQDCIEALIEFQKSRNTDGLLTQIVIACNALLQADVMRVVADKLLTLPVADSCEKESSNEVDPLTTTSSDENEPVPTAMNMEWHAIKEILKRRKFKGKVQYLVSWESDNSQSWVNRGDLTDAAVQHFIAKNGRRKRARKR